MQQGQARGGSEGTMERVGGTRKTVYGGCCLAGKVPDVWGLLTRPLKGSLLI